MLLQFDNTLKETNASVVGPYVSGAPSLHLEESVFVHKNILVSIPLGDLQATSTVSAAVDPVTGAETWQSPPLRGTLPINDLNFYDLYGAGQKEIAFGRPSGVCHAVAAL
jgi:hypothetical protein